MQDIILILSQEAETAAMIAHTLRWRQQYCTILSPSVSMDVLMSYAPNGVIVVGENAFDQIDPALLEGDVPLLALGEAAAELCASYGGQREEKKTPEENLMLSLSDHPLFHDCMSGERRVDGFFPLRLPERLEGLMYAGEDCIAFRHLEKQHFGVQYPIERHDPDGAQLLSNFAHSVCGCREEWNTDAIIDDSLEVIRSQTEGCDNVICAVSGGVDSTVCAKLASLAVGSRLHCLFIDTGFFRQDEPRTIIADFEEYMGIEVEYIDARERFLQQISGMSNDLEKDEAVSRLIGDLILEKLQSLGEKSALLLGTNFSDLMDGFTSAVDADSPAALPNPVVEPLKKLFKNEVRRLAQTLQLPASFSGRQAFPAAGLASRVFGEVTQQRLDILRKAEACFTDEILENGFERKLRKFYAVLLRSPENPDAYSISLRALQAGRTNASARIPFDLLERTTERILREIPGVSRVVYDLTPSQSFGEVE